MDRCSPYGWAHSQWSSSATLTLEERPSARMSSSVDLEISLVGIEFLGDKHVHFMSGRGMKIF